MVAVPLSILGIGVSMAVLFVTLWNLYLSHYKEGQSDVELLPQENDPTAGFRGGNLAIDHDAKWTGNFYLKIVNTGEKGAYIASFDHSLKGFQKNGELTDASKTNLELNEHRTSWVGNEIEPHSTTRYRASAAISPENDIGAFVENDFAVIEHELTVEDNKGSYTVHHETAVELTGPDQAVENWRKEQPELS